jgi:hypothetical protein
VDDKTRVCAFARVLEDDSAVVLLNASGSTHHVQLDVFELGWADGQRIQEALNGEEMIVSNGRLEVGLEPHGGALLYA